MYSTVFFVKKKAGQPHDEFVRKWIVDHTPLTAKVAGIRSYRCWPFHDGQGGQYDGVGVITFDDKETADKAFATPEFKAALADAVNFQTTELTIDFSADEYVIV
jgi:uncharacterized protein (TIGR02118 family)